MSAYEIYTAVAANPFTELFQYMSLRNNFNYLAPYCVIADRMLVRSKGNWEKVPAVFPLALCTVKRLWNLYWENLYWESRHCPTILQSCSFF